MISISHMLFSSRKSAIWRPLRLLAGVAAMLLAVLPLAAQSCKEPGEMEPATRSAIEAAANSYQQMSARGDVAGLRAAAIPSLAANFGGVEQAVADNKDALNGAATIRKSYLLEQATGGSGRSEFFCGVFGARGNTENSAGFVLNSLPAGRYAVVIQDISGSKGSHTLSQVLQETGGQWKLAGYYAKSTLVAGHDSDWYAQQARQFKQKGQSLAAWFYFWEARDLAAPVPFISTLKLDKLYEEAETVRPKDFPTGAPIDANLGGRTFKLLAAFPVVVSDQLDLVVKYQSADISNTAQTFQDNTALMRGLVAKYPEFKDAFAGIVARAVAPDGRDYGTLLAVKDIK